MNEGDVIKMIKATGILKPDKQKVNEPDESESDD